MFWTFTTYNIRTHQIAKQLNFKVEKKRVETIYKELYDVYKFIIETNICLN